MTESSPGSFKLSFKGVDYLPTADATAAGVLLFGLRPRGVRFVAKGLTTDMFQYFALHAAYILHLHANGDLRTADGQRRVPLEDLHRWVELGVALAPTADTAIDARRLINESLGPSAYEA
jgi:hypothetical protein